MIGGPADEIAAQLRNNTEGAAIVATLGNLQIRVVPRRQPQPFGRHEIDIGIMQRRRGGVHRFHYLLVLMRTRYSQDARVGLADAALFDAETSGDDHPAVLGQRLADGIKTFLLGGIEKAAGVDDDDVSAIIVPGDLVTFRSELGDDALAVDQRLGTAERDEPDLRHFVLR